MSSGCTSVVVAFDEYRKISLKAATRKKRAGKKLPIQYEVNESIIIEEITMKELLSHQDTKRDLSRYFQEQLHENLKKQTNLKYVVAGNGETVGSNIDGFMQNSHEEADSLMLHAWTHIPLTGETILVNSNDTDVFVLFVSLIQYMQCEKVIMKWLNDMLIDLTKISIDLGRHAVGLIGLHAFTGCDIMEKFSGKSKQI